MLKLKSEEDFSNETSQMQQDNVILMRELEEVEEDALHFQNQIKGFKEKLRVATGVNHKKGRDGKMKMSAVLNSIKDYDSELTQEGDQLRMRNLCYDDVGVSQRICCFATYFEHC